MPEIWKKIKSEVMTTLKKKFRQNAQIFKSQSRTSSFESRTIWWNLGLVLEFQPGLRLESHGLDYIIGYQEVEYSKSFP